MNKGLLPGLNEDGWRRYDPQWILAGPIDATRVQPTVDTQNAAAQWSSGKPFGRYLVCDGGAYVVVEIQLSMTGNTTIGSPGTGASPVSDAYLFSLPVPARRWTGEGQPSYAPLGLAMSYWNLDSPSQNTTPMTVTLADPFASLSGRENNYIQCYCPELKAWGAGTLSGATATPTLTSGLGSTDILYPEDIELVFIDATSISSAAGIAAITSTTHGSFTVQTFGSTSAADFRWEYKGKSPGASGPLLSPAMPWDWARTVGTGPFGNIFLQCAYEPKR